LGAMDYIRKPIEFAVMAGKVGRFIPVKDPGL
jgi:hypothetical protein